jgi:hypothetical protein
MSAWRQSGISWVLRSGRRLCHSGRTTSAPDAAIINRLNSTASTWRTSMRCSANWMTLSWCSAKMSRARMVPRATRPRASSRETIEQRQRICAITADRHRQFAFKHHLGYQSGNAHGEMIDHREVVGVDGPRDAVDAGLFLFGCRQWRGLHAFSSRGRNQSHGR